MVEYGYEYINDKNKYVCEYIDIYQKHEYSYKCIGLYINSLMFRNVVRVTTKIKVRVRFRFIVSSET